MMLRFTCCEKLLALSTTTQPLHAALGTGLGKGSQLGQRVPVCLAKGVSNACQVPCKKDLRSTLSGEAIKLRGCKVEARVNQRGLEKAARRLLGKFQTLAAVSRVQSLEARPRANVASKARKEHCSNAAGCSATFAGTWKIPQQGRVL